MVSEPAGHTRVLVVIDTTGAAGPGDVIPVTRASGKSVAVAARRGKDQRLAGVGYMWVFSAMAHSVGARAHNDR